MSGDSPRPRVYAECTSDPRNRKINMLYVYFLIVRHLRVLADIVSLNILTSIEIYMYYGRVRLSGIKNLINYKFVYLKFYRKD